jgi:hypothetical protein
MAEISRPGGAVAGAEPERLTADSRRTIVGAFFGFFVDMFDVYLPVVALTPARTSRPPISTSCSR